MSRATITGVTGGAYGIAAAYAAVRALADVFDGAGSTLRGWAGLGARVAADPALVASAPLSPATFAEAERAVLAATAGPDGVLVESVGWEADAVLVRAVVTAFEDTDRLVRAGVDALDHLVGRVVGITLGATAPALLPAAAVAAPYMPAGTRRDLEQWVVDHPGAVQHAVNGGGGLLEGLWDGLTPLVPGGPLGMPLLTPDTESGAGLLAAAYGEDGTAHVFPVHDTVPGGSRPPAGVSDLVAHLGEVAALSPDPDSPLNGTIEVQTLRGDAGVRHIVYLPGTDDLATLPWTQDGDVRDMGTNLLLVAGQDNAYQQGIRDAMAQAHIGPSDPVLLVGHSQGGMEAAAILSQGSGYHVTNVVTAGSPTAHVDGFPTGSHVLSLEHRGDVVPLLDGEDNPDSVQQVTVTFDHRGEGIVERHGYDAYVAGAAAVDTSADASVVEQLDSLRAHGFLSGSEEGRTSVSSQVFQVVRHR